MSYKDRQYRKGPKRYLVLDQDQQGRVVEDARGQRYVVVANKYGRRAMIRKLTDSTRRVQEELGLPVRTATTFKEWVDWLTGRQDG